jgi:hypothetical protein
MEEEPGIFKADPLFRQWCLAKMEEHGGNMALLVMLLDTGANCEVAELAQANLHGPNIGAFVAEFITRKTNAGKPNAGKRGKKKAASVAHVGATRPQAQAAAPQAGPDDGWALAGGGGKTKNKAKKAAGGRGQGGQMAATQNGNPFAALPSS